MRENAIREQYQSGQINVLHIAGKINPSDMFTKEEKSTEHFQKTRDSIMIREEDFDSEEVFNSSNTTIHLPHHNQRQTMEKSFIPANHLPIHQKKSSAENILKI